MLSGISNATSNRIATFPDRRNQAGQDAFADLMATPGDSKPDNSSTAPFDNRGISYAAIETNFNTWSHQRRVDGAGDDYMNRVDAAKTTYLDIARKAEASGGFADPVAFVRTLGTHELDALQTINSLGAAIDPASLTEEGALNLLLTRTMARDIDGDGLMMVGEASTFVFPPGDAPQAVKDAWEKTTEGMDFGTKLHLQMSMHLAGNAVRAESGGSSVAADYSALVDRAIDGATFNLNISPSDQRAFNSKILDGLNLLRTYLSATDV